MKRFSIIAISALIALSFGACDLFDTVDDAECAAAIQQAVLSGTREVSNSTMPLGSLAASRALVEGVAITVRNPDGGQAVYTVEANEDGTRSIHFEYTDWYVEDGDEEYTVDGELDMVMAQAETELGETGSEFSMSFSTTGEMTVSRNGKSKSGEIDITTSVLIVMDTSAEDSIEITSTLTTTGTVAGVSVNDTKTFTMTIDFDF